ncbi:MAG TPA: hypothetical protein PKC24_02970 [Cyclobacteriaceae bacterium]|nr:hypothetical protein [Cyclobacteriaceae bacterium]
MEEKLNWKAIDSYSLSFSGKLVQDFFSKKFKISGKEILNLSPVKQVNLFVLDELLKAWKEESEKMKSPYFDFDAAEVKESFQNFMNVLSNNILIDSGHFAPMLKMATTNTLLLVFAPYDYFSRMIKEQPIIKLANLKERLRYIKINQEPLNGLVEEIERRGIKELSGAEAFKMLDHILQELSFSPADFEEYIQQFSSILALDPEKFYTSFSPPAQVVTEPKPAIAAQSGKNMLNESLAKTEKPSLADNFQRTKIKSIKESLSINQRFMFVNALFKGNAEICNKSIDFIDSCADKSVAYRFIAENHADWDKESEEYLEFMELVEKRFL